MADPALDPIPVIGYLDITDDNAPIDEVGMNVLMAHPLTFQVLVRDCGFPVRTAIAVIAHHLRKRGEVRADAAYRIWREIRWLLIGGAITSAIIWAKNNL